LKNTGRKQITAIEDGDSVKPGMKPAAECRVRFDKTSKLSKRATENTMIAISVARFHGLWSIS
jgi:hypothetical protein